MKDITPLPDQDMIHLDVARAKIHPKIYLLDAYKQVYVVPSNVHKMAFATIYGIFMSNVMQQGNCNAPLDVPASDELHILRLYLHTYLDNQQFGARAPKAPGIGICSFT